MQYLQYLLLAVIVVLFLFFIFIIVLATGILTPKWIVLEVLESANKEDLRDLEYFLRTNKGRQPVVLNIKGTIIETKMKGDYDSLFRFSLSKPFNINQY